MVLGQSDRRLDLVRGSQRLSKKTKLAQGAIMLESTEITWHMVLRMAGREAGPCERWPTTLKGELENNSRKPRDLTKNWHSDSPKYVNLLFLKVR